MLKTFSVVLVFIATVLQLLTLSNSSTIPPVKLSPAKVEELAKNVPKPNSNDIMKGMDEFFKLYGPSFKKMRETGGLIPNPPKGRKAFRNKAIADNEVGVNKRKKSSPPGKKKIIRKNKKIQKKVEERRHIGKVPQREKFHFGDPPSGLLEDQRKSAEYYEDSIESQKEAFEAILDENAKNRKRPRKLSHASYIRLKYDYQTKKYSITENSDE